MSRSQHINARGSIHRKTRAARNTFERGQVVVESPSPRRRPPKISPNEGSSDTVDNDNQWDHRQFLTVLEDHKKYAKFYESVGLTPKELYDEVIKRSRDRPFKFKDLLMRLIEEDGELIEEGERVTPVNLSGSSNIGPVPSFRSLDPAFTAKTKKRENTARNSPLTIGRESFRSSIESVPAVMKHDDEVVPVHQDVFANMTRFAHKGNTEVYRNPLHSEISQNSESFGNDLGYKEARDAVPRLSDMNVPINEHSLVPHPPPMPGGSMTERGTAATGRRVKKVKKPFNRTAENSGHSKPMANAGEEQIYGPFFRRWKPCNDTGLSPRINLQKGVCQPNLPPINEALLDPMQRARLSPKRKKNRKEAERKCNDLQREAAEKVRQYVESDQNSERQGLRVAEPKPVTSQSDMQPPEMLEGAEEEKPALSPPPKVQLIPDPNMGAPHMDRKPVAMHVLDIGRTEFVIPQSRRCVPGTMPSIPDSNNFLTPWVVPNLRGTPNTVWSSRPGARESRASIANTNAVK